ncbi:hypothetical protein O0L34_g6733 [Tuta absoluta]|nr:hypothetical protein O0L34_g6733 [Tuta absoluta]
MQREVSVHAGAATQRAASPAAAAAAPAPAAAAAPRALHAERGECARWCCDTTRRQRQQRRARYMQREREEADNSNERFYDATEENVNHSAAGDRLIELELERLDNVPEDIEVHDDDRDEAHDTEDDVDNRYSETDGQDIKKDDASNSYDETEENQLKLEEEPLDNDETEDKESAKGDQKSDTVRKVRNKRKEYSSRASGSRDQDKVSKSRRRSWTPKSSRRYVENEERPVTEVPEERERSQGAGTSRMEWETSDAADDEVGSDEETDTVEIVKTKEEKRQKLDSGIGEENSPSGGSASHKSGADSEPEPEPETQRDSCDSDRSDYDQVRGRRVRQKRGHLSTRSSSSTEEEIERDENGQYHSRRSGKPRTDQHAVRRNTLSALMKEAVKELPLPQPLQVFVNLGRSVDM